MSDDEDRPGDEPSTPPARSAAPAKKKAAGAKGVAAAAGAGKGKKSAGAAKPAPSKEGKAVSPTEGKTKKTAAAAPRKRKAPASDTNKEDAEEDDEDESTRAPRAKKAKKAAGAASTAPNGKKQQADKKQTIEKQAGEGSSTPTAAPSSTAEGEDDAKANEKKERNEVYEMVLSNIRNQNTVILDTRWNLPFALPKKANIALTPERWRQVVSETGDKLTTDVVCVNPQTLTIEDPLVVEDIQPVRASPTYCFLNEREINLKLKNLLNTNILLGSSLSLAHHGTEGKKAGAKKTFTPGEWVVWVRSGDGPSARRIAMALATFAELVRNRQTGQPITLSSPSGWTMFSEEDRIFVVPRGFLPSHLSNPAQNGEAPAGPTPTPTAAPAGASKDPPTPPPTVTPAVALSQNAPALINPNTAAPSSNAPAPATTAPVAAASN